MTQNIYTHAVFVSGVVLYGCTVAKDDECVEILIRVILFFDFVLTRAEVSCSIITVI